MEYKIVGDVMQAFTLTLQRGEEIYAEVGAMLYMSDGIELESQMRGGFLKGLAGSAPVFSAAKASVANVDQHQGVGGFGGILKDVISGE